MVEFIRRRRRAAGDAAGGSEEIADFRHLQAAARHLADGPDRRRIVWLEGLHLPTSVRIAEDAPVEPVG